MVTLQRVVKLLVCFGLMTIFLGCAVAQKQESTGQYVDDSVITTEVKTAILQEPTLKTFDVNVKTFNGVVQLNGFVDTKDNIKKAGEVASTVKGVKTVQNNLAVKPGQ